MKISLTFDSLPEVDQFAQDWLGKRGKAPAPSAPAPAPVVMTTPAVVPAPVVMTTPAVVPAQAITAELRTPAAPVQAITAELRTPAAPVPPVTAGPAVQTPMPAPQPAQAPVTIEDVTRAAVALADQGRKNDLLALLGKFGVRAITELGPDQLGPFKQALDILGGLA